MARRKAHSEPVVVVRNEFQVPRDDIPSCPPVRGRGNRDTELALAKLFRRHGITGWRRHPAMFGKPDFVFRKERLVVFVDGCFWHNCPKHSNLPVNNREFWRAKLTGNLKRDRLVVRTLRGEGWRVLRIWEHEMARRNEPRLLRRLRRVLHRA